MKLSKSAMRVRHVRVGHLTLQPASATIDERPPGRPRTFSTDRSGNVTNGVVIPEKLRKLIGTVTPKKDPEPDVALRPSFSGWGFF
jgi:hypothetical protein